MATHICCATFFQEGDYSGIYDGSPLLRCGRCKATWYVDRDAQKSVWKAHKHLCKELTKNDRQRIDQLSLAESAELLRRSVDGTTTFGRHDAVYLMKHVRKMFDENAPDPEDVELSIHTTGRSLIFRPSLYMRMYQQPGFTDYVLTDNQEDLLNDKTRFLKNHLSRYNGRPADEYVEHLISNQDEKKRVVAAVEEYDEMEEAQLSTFDSPSSMKYCYLYFNLLVATAVQSPPSASSVHDGCGTLRLGAPRGSISRLAVLALRRAMRLWTEPFVRSSCGDAMAPAASLALTALETFGEGRTELDQHRESVDELAPGLKIDSTVKACLSELSEHAASSHFSRRVLDHIANVRSNTWDYLEAERRAAVLLAMIAFLMDSGDAAEGDGDSFQCLLSLNRMLSAVCGKDEIRDSVWKVASESELLGPEPAGHNGYSRAVVHYWIRKDVDDYGMSDWNDASDIEKEECLALANSPMMQ